MKTLIKSPLKNAANNIVKIGSTPNARKIKSLDFDRPRENETFIKWIESSSKIFESVDLPNKKELKKLADFDVIGGGGGLAGLLAALGGLGLSLTGGFGLPGLPRFGRFKSPKTKRPKNKSNKNTGRPGGRPGSLTGRPRTDSRGNQIARRGAQYRSQLGRILRPGQTPAGLTMGPRPGSLQSRFASARANMQTGTLFGGRGAALQRGLYNAPGRLQRGVQASRQAISRVTQPVTTRLSAARGGISKAISPFKTALKGVSRIPIIGSLLAGVFTYFEDENGDGIPDRNLNKALFVSGGTAIGGLLGSFIPIPILGTLMGTLIGEYAGGLFYELIQGRGAEFVGKKFQDDMKKLLSAGQAVVNWAGRGFKRLYEGFPKLNVFGIGEVINPFKMHEGVLKLPKAFFSDAPMNETKAEESERLKKEEEERKKQQQQREEEQRNRSEAIQDEEQLPYTTTEDGEVVPTMASFREDNEENAALQAENQSMVSGLGLVNPTPMTDLATQKGGYAADTGLDIHGNIGDPIVSPVDGVLEYAEEGHTAQANQDSDPTTPGFQPQHSFRIRLNKPFSYNGKTVRFIYGTHLATLDKAVANKFDIPIKKGQRLGTMGQANNVPHLHLGLVGDRAQTEFLNFNEVKGALLKNRAVQARSTSPQVPLPATTAATQSNSVVVIPQQQQNQQSGSQIIPIPMNGGSRSQGADQMSAGVSESDVLNSLWQTLLLTKLSE